MLILGKDGRMIDTSGNLLDYGLGGTPQPQPQPQQQPVTLLPGQTAIPDVSQMTYQQLINSQPFVEGRYDDRKALFDQWTTQVLVPSVMASKGNESEKSAAIAQVRSIFDSQFQRPTSSFVMDKLNALDQGVAMGVGSLAQGVADVASWVGPDDNWISKGAQYIADRTNEHLDYKTKYTGSTQLQEDRRIAAQHMAKANGDLEKIGAFWNNLTDAPLTTAIELVGQATPYIAGGAISGGVRGAAALGTVAGVGEGTQAAIDNNKAYLTRYYAQQGIKKTPQEIEADAIAATRGFQGGDALSALGGAVGAIPAAKLGGAISSITGRGINRGVAQEIAQSVTSDTAKLGARDVAKSAAKELGQGALLEGGGAGITAVGGNLATVNPETRWSDDVFFNMVSEAVAGGVMGAGSFIGEAVNAGRHNRAVDAAVARDEAHMRLAQLSVEYANERYMLDNGPLPRIGTPEYAQAQPILAQYQRDFMTSADPRQLTAELLDRKAQQPSADQVTPSNDMATTVQAPDATSQGTQPTATTTLTQPEFFGADEAPIPATATSSATTSTATRPDLFDPTTDLFDPTTDLFDLTGETSSATTSAATWPDLFDLTGETSSATTSPVPPPPPPPPPVPPVPATTSTATWPESFWADEAPVPASPPTTGLPLPTTSTATRPGLFDPTTGLPLPTTSDILGGVEETLSAAPSAEELRKFLIARLNRARGANRRAMMDFIMAFIDGLRGRRTGTAEQSTPKLTTADEIADAFDEAANKVSNETANGATNGQSDDTTRSGSSSVPATESTSASGSDAVSQQGASGSDNTVRGQGTEADTVQPTGSITTEDTTATDAGGDNSPVQRRGKRTKQQSGADTTTNAGTKQGARKRSTDTPTPEPTGSDGQQGTDSQNQNGNSDFDLDAINRDIYKLLSGKSSSPSAGLAASFRLLVEDLAPANADSLLRGSPIADAWIELQDKMQAGTLTAGEAKDFFSRIPQDFFKYDRGSLLNFLDEFTAAVDADPTLSIYDYAPNKGILSLNPIQGTDKSARMAELDDDGNVAAASVFVHPTIIKEASSLRVAKTLGTRDPAIALASELAIKDLKQAGVSQTAIDSIMRAKGLEEEKQLLRERLLDAGTTILYNGRGSITNNLIKTLAQDINSLIPPPASKPKSGKKLGEADARTEPQASISQVSPQVSPQVPPQVPPQATPRDTIYNVTEFKQSLPPRLQASFDARVARGASREAGGIVMVDTSADLPVGQSIANMDKAQAIYDPVSGITYFVKGSLDANDVHSVYLHEAWHGNADPTIEAQVQEAINNRSTATGAERELLDRVAERQANADVTGDATESVSYLVEEAVKMGHQAGFSAVDGAFMRWVDETFPRVAEAIYRTVAELRNFLRKYGLVNTVKVDDLIQMAEASANKLAQGTTTVTNDTPLASIATQTKAIVDKIQKSSASPDPMASQDDLLAFARSGKARDVVVPNYRQRATTLKDKIVRNFVDANTALRQQFLPLYELLEKGIALRGTVMSKELEPVMKKYWQDLGHAADAIKARAKVGKEVDASYKDLNAETLSNTVGHYATAKYVAGDANNKGANHAKAEYFRHQQALSEAAINEILTKHPELAVFNVDSISQLTEEQRKAFNDAVQVNDTAEWDIARARNQLREAIRKDPERTKAKEELLDQVEDYEWLRLYEQYDNQILTKDELEASGYRPIGGMTSAMAEQVVNDLEYRHGIGQELKSLHNSLLAIQHKTTELGDRYGVYSDEDRANRDGSALYVPTTGRNDVINQLQEAKAMDDWEVQDAILQDLFNTMGYGTGINNRNLHRSREGRASLADPADKAIMDRMYAMANALSTVRFKDETVKTALAGMDQDLYEKAKAGTLTRAELDVFLRRTRSQSSTGVHIVHDRNNNANTTDIRHMFEVKDETGATTLYPLRIVFTDASIGKTLRNATIESPNSIIKTLAGMARISQRMITLDPIFPIKSMIRDVPERWLTLASRDFKDKDGKPITIDAWRQVKKSAAYIFKHLGLRTAEQRNNNAVWQFVTHGKFLDNAQGQLLRDLALSKDGSGLTTQSHILSTGATNRRKMIEREFGKTWFGLPRRYIARASEAITNWSEYFEVQSALATYKGLLDLGMAPEAARTALLDTMNFSRRGNLTATLRPLYFFINPSIQGASNTLGAFRNDYVRYKEGKGSGLPATMTLRTTTMLVKYTLLGTLLQSTLGLIGGGDEDDEYVGNYYDRNPIAKRMREIALPVPVGDDFVTIPVPYGLGSIGWGLGQLLREVSRGEMSVGKASRELSHLLGKELTGLPLSDVSMVDNPVEWLFRTISPQPLQGVIDTATGRNRWGTAINRPYLDATKYKAEQGKATTENTYKDIAIFLKDTAGVDFTPEEVKHLIAGTIAGPLSRIIKGMEESTQNPTNGIIRMTGLTSFYNTGATKPLEAAYYRKMETIEPLLKELNSLAPLASGGRESLDELYIRAINTNAFTPHEVIQMVAAVKARRALRGADANERDMYMRNFIREIR